MIFLSLGTTVQPFARAVTLMTPFVKSGEEVIVQYGLTEPDPTLESATWVEFMPHQELEATVRQSRAFFCHAGVGSVLTSLAQDVTPIIIPREKRFGEHVDDHQLDLAFKLAERGLAVVLPLGDEDVERAVLAAAAIRVEAAGRGQRLFRAVDHIVHGATVKV